MSMFLLDPRIVHTRIIKCRPNDKATYNSLIDHYSKSQLSKHMRQSYALRIFNAYLCKPTVVSWTCLISALGDTCSFLTQFVSLLRYVTMPNHRTLLFDEMPEKDSVCYSAVIVGLTQNSQPVEALSCFYDMVACGVLSTEHSVSAVLSAVGDIAMVEICKVIHGHAVVTGYYRESLWGLRCLTLMENVVGWNAMMASYAQRGEGKSVCDLFTSMNARGYTRDEDTCLAVLSSLQNAGLADEAKKCLNKMKSEYDVEPQFEHYTCLVGALGGVGRLKDAERVAMCMPFETDDALWRTVLTTCASHVSWRCEHGLYCWLQAARA
ncbi:unnamed protein product [Rhodiola kirilowii]